jgi:predicted NUDIX family phosphoesterase
MTHSSTERVLVFPTSLLQHLGPFQGFSPAVSRYLPALLDPANLSYLPRSQAEGDPTYKQLIPYVVLRCGGQIFSYLRGQAGTEGRLRGLRSLGVGGHISAEDGTLDSDPYRKGLLRELEEEVALPTPLSERVIGLINDDRTPVGQVHFGIVHLLDLPQATVQPRESALAGGGFTTLPWLQEHQEEFETWSQFLLEQQGLLAS